MPKIYVGYRHEHHDAEGYEGPVLNVAWGMVRNIFGVFGIFLSRVPYPVDTRFRGGHFFWPLLYICICICIYTVSLVLKYQLLAFNNGQKK